MNVDLQKFFDRYMCKAGRFVPARLQAAVALLERLREHPSLDLQNHVPAGSSGIESHETYGNQAHERLGLQAINKNHGRRSSHLNEWGQPLLDLLGKNGYAKNSKDAVDSTQAEFAKALRNILESEPLTVRIKGRSAEAVVADLLEQAEERGKAGAVAQYLVGAKLQLRFPGIQIPTHPYNKGDRKKRGDDDARLADFELAEGVIEVALGMPDEKHIEQVLTALDDSEAEVWLLARSHRVAAWQAEVGRIESSLRQRVVVTSVEMFVGQNVSELAAFSLKAKGETLLALFQIYNEVWVSKLGPPSLRVVVKS